MFPHLSPVPSSVSGFFGVVGIAIRMRRRMARTVMLVQLLGAIRPLEFMALTGNARQRNSHDQ